MAAGSPSLTTIKTDQTTLYKSLNGPTGNGTRNRPMKTKYIPAVPKTTSNNNIWPLLSRKIRNNKSRHKKTLIAKPNKGIMKTNPIEIAGIAKNSSLVFSMIGKERNLMSCITDNTAQTKKIPATMRGNCDGETTE